MVIVVLAIVAKSGEYVQLHTGDAGSHVGSGCDGPHASATAAVHR